MRKKKRSDVLRVTDNLDETIAAAWRALDAAIDNNARAIAEAEKMIADLQRRAITREVGT